MAYLQKQNEELGKQQQVSIGKHNRESLLQDPHNDNVLYALAHKKPNQKENSLMENEDENEEMDSQEALKKKGPSRPSIT